mmetsp:Transcript_9492/g.17854  ORF Transcript_9492/g.17854 Transcript_9492/m.17854 type:complete len:265 (-) Transcript_9492:724-1518(-)
MVSSSTSQEAAFGSHVFMLQYQISGRSSAEIRGGNRRHFSHFSHCTHSWLSASLFSLLLLEDRSLPESRSLPRSLSLSRRLLSLSLSLFRSRAASLELALDLDMEAMSLAVSLAAAEFTSSADCFPFLDPPDELLPSFATSSLKRSSSISASSESTISGDEFLATAAVNSGSGSATFTTRASADASLLSTSSERGGDDLLVGSNSRCAPVPDSLSVALPSGEELLPPPPPRAIFAFLAFLDSFFSASISLAVCSGASQLFRRSS